MSSSRKYTRREVLQAGLGAGAFTTLGTLGSCGGGADRCAGGPLAPPGEGTAAAGARRLLAGIDTVVVVMMENRSFDHLFGSLATDPRYPAAARVDGLTGRESNPDGGGRDVMVNVAGGIATLNPKHDWASSHRQFGDGRNDGFIVTSAGANQTEAMSYHRRATAPVFYDLADRYVVCDRWFSSVMGPTWPNRFYLLAGTAAGRKDTGVMGLDAPPTVWQRMAERCYPVKNYFAGPIAFYSAGFPANAVSGDDAVTPEPIDRFFVDAERGQLPSFSIIDPDWGVNDAHPPHDLALAEAFVASIHRALAAGPQWPRSLLVVVFDEHGGFYDHVPPPPAVDADPDFRRLGFRVPALVIGPSVRRGEVVSTVFDHASILATLATRFGMASLGPRMDAAADLSACIDPAYAAGGDAALRSPAPALPATVEVRAQAIRRAPLRPTSQPEIAALMAAGRVPGHHVDGRSPEERFGAWLRRAQALEAIRVIA